VSFQKKRKNVESFSTLKLLTDAFSVKHYTHVMLYMQHYIGIVHFRLKYNGFGTVQRTTKLIEGDHRGLQSYRPICYYFYFLKCFFTFF